MSNPRFAFALLAAFALASTSLVAGGRVEITNQSKQPWTLRLKEGPPATVTVRGQDNQTSTPANTDAVPVGPGETCVVAFKPRMGMPVSLDIGLVDRTGLEAGLIRVQPAPVSCVRQFLSSLLGRGDGTVSPTAAATDSKDADAWLIHSDFWSDPYD
jgi:hypothetical protein